MTKVCDCYDGIIFTIFTFWSDFTQNTVFPRYSQGYVPDKSQTGILKSIFGICGFWLFK